MAEVRKNDKGQVATLIYEHRGVARNVKPKCVRCGEDAVFLCDAKRDKILAYYQDDAPRQDRCSAPLCAEHAYIEPDGQHHCWHHRSPEAVRIPK